MDDLKSSHFKPCFIWDFPIDGAQFILDSDTENEKRVEEPMPFSDSESIVSSDDSEESLEVNSEFTCHKCELVFEDVSSQRLHFQSTLHRSKVSTTPTSHLNNNITSDLEYEQSFSWLNETVNKFSLDSTKEKRTPSSPFLTFRLVHSHSLHLKVYKHCLSSIPLSSSQELHRAWMSFYEKPQHIVYILLAGGSFSIAEYQSEKCLDHTSVKRYITRRKQGGSQSSHDQKKHARSAGANLRRYNEAALVSDVFRILSSWSTRLLEADRVFYFAPCRNRAILFRHPSLSRLTFSIPISVKKAMFTEIQRVHSILYKVTLVEPVFVPSMPTKIESRPTLTPIQSTLIPVHDAVPEPSDEHSIKKSKKKQKKTTSSDLPLLPSELELSFPMTVAPPPPNLFSSTLDPEFLKVIEREKRALAAEKRMRQAISQTTASSSSPPPSKVCSQCNQVIQKMPVQRSRGLFCSIPCASKWAKQNLSTLPLT